MNRLNANWRRCLEAAAIEPMLFKDLRASWQTNCRWELGMPPWLVEPMMGHLSEGVTGRHYDRPLRDQFAEGAVAAYASNPFAG